MPGVAETIAAALSVPIEAAARRVGQARIHIRALRPFGAIAQHIDHQILFNHHHRLDADGACVADGAQLAVVIAVGLPVVPN